jgi:hypothetical protein
LDSYRDLPFTNHVHRLVTFNRPQRTFNRSEPKAGGDALFDEPVILLKYVVQIR